MVAPDVNDDRGEMLRQLLFSAEVLERAGELQRSQVSHEDRLHLCCPFPSTWTCLANLGCVWMQMLYMELSLFLAAECAADPQNVIFTERLRQDCEAALLRLQGSPKLDQQRCDV